ncbi:Electron transport complex subunit RsxA [Candidatus Hartigia pinicola]|nr:Electron transport complex subunit RsxA [Candidatus Hartigia pinicola]
MTDYVLLFTGAALVNNFVLVKCLGIYQFIDVSKKLETAIGISLSTTFVITFSSMSLWLMDKLILIPLNLLYLRTLSLILIIALVVQFTEIVVRKTSLIVHHFLGIFFPLVSTNCSMLGIILLNNNQLNSFLQFSVYGFSAAISFSVVMVLFTAMRERLAIANVPVLFRGLSINLLTSGLMSLAFMGLKGLVKF